MTPWFVDMALGIILGLLLYACVRLRMYAGPRLKEAYGQWPRRIAWAMILLLMIGIGNLVLYAERVYLRNAGVGEDTLLHEVLFAIIGLVLGLWLVMARIYRRK